MKIKKGDRVRFLNDVGSGIVVKLLSSEEVLVEDNNGFEYPYPISEVILIDQNLEEHAKYESKQPKFHEVLARNIDEKKLKTAEKDFESRAYNENKKAHRKKGEVMEVDLHMHEILDDERGLDPGEMLEVQMKHFERMMKRAEQGRVNRVVFIHGVGQGVLRNEIRNALTEYYPNCTFHDASYQEYGYGATEVIIR